MKLHRLHVAQGSNAGLQRDGGRNTFGDHRIRRHTIEPPCSAAGNRGSLGDVSSQLPGNKISHHGAVTATAVVDQRDCLGPFMHRYVLGNRLIAHRIEHGVAGAVRNKTGAPLVGAAEGALSDQAMGFVALGDGDFLAVDDDVAIALGHPAPGQAPGRQLAHRFGRGIDEHPHDFLIGAPVATADGVFEMNVFVVALTLDHIGKTGLHAALRRGGMRTLGRHQ